MGEPAAAFIMLNSWIIVWLYAGGHQGHTVGPAGRLDRAVLEAIEAFLGLVKEKGEFNHLRYSLDCPLGYHFWAPATWRVGTLRRLKTFVAAMARSNAAIPASL